MNLAAYRKLISAKRYARLSATLARAKAEEMALSWTRLKPLEKLVLFKLMDAEPALALYQALPFEEKYFLLLGHPTDSVAPMIEGLSPGVRRLFCRKPSGFYDRMLKLLVGAEIQLPLSYDRN
ncbi:MAG TPA: hypothetical protein DCM05_12070 [Elusimicrobia bacterium]|nr:hypothetical protein [Elusimicrobiota bacterium]